MNTYPKIKLKKGKDASLKRFHPWIFSGAIAHRPDDLTEGQVVEVWSHDGEYLATGHFQIGSIMVRIFAFQQEEIHAAFWKVKLEKAVRWRKEIGLWGSKETNIFRLVHGEGDGLPGLIVDYYGGVAVVQCHSVGFYLVRQQIAEALKEIMGEDIQAVFDKSSHSLPFKAPVEPVDGYLLGESQTWQAKESGNAYQIDVEKGQKTGFFVDQRENRSLLSEYSKGKYVLNTFCYTGGFSVAALTGGASAVDSVDSSAGAIRLTDENVRLNFGEEAPHQSFATDAFEYLKDIQDRYDVIVLDPPAFAKHHNVLDRALKGYRKINRLAFEQIKPGGILFTFSCSQVVSKDAF
ncbi:MAG: class I SAM-dependent rRNA methyltransferase, partial [Bacteroidota bacterium]